MLIEGVGLVHAGTGRGGAGTGRGLTGRFQKPVPVQLKTTPHPNNGGLRVWKSVASCQAFATLSVSASAHS